MSWHDRHDSSSWPPPLRRSGIEPKGFHMANVPHDASGGLRRTEDVEVPRKSPKRLYGSPKLTDHGSLVRLTQQLPGDFNPLGSPV